jgi:hypothetical protein
MLSLRRECLGDPDGDVLALSETEIDVTCQMYAHFVFFSHLGVVSCSTLLTLSSFGRALIAPDVLCYSSKEL